MSTMDLSVKERLLLLLVVPPVGNITQLEIIRELRESLSFNAELQEKLKLVENEETGGTTWDDKVEAEIGPWPFEFNRVVRKIINKAMKRALTKMSEQEVLTEDHLNVGERFVDNWDDFKRDLKAAEVRRAEEAEIEEERAAKMAKDVAKKKKQKAAALIAETKAEQAAEKEAEDAAHGGSK